MTQYMSLHAADLPLLCSKLQDSTPFGYLHNLWTKFYVQWSMKYGLIYITGFIWYSLDVTV